MQIRFLNSYVHHLPDGKQVYIHHFKMIYSKSNKVLILFDGHKFNGSHYCSLLQTKTEKLCYF